jgi:enoyl-CoA hydratase/carnithine racemase
MRCQLQVQILGEAVQQEDLVLTEFGGGVAVLTLNRPGSANALIPTLVDSLTEAIIAANNDPSVRVLVLKGSGSSFCGGADLSFLESVIGMSAEEIQRQVYGKFQGLTRLLRTCAKPVVAAVNGAAYGAGCEIAVACDFRIVSEDAVFSENWIDIGAMPALGGLSLLPRLIGFERAADMVMRGTKVGGKTAAAIGLATQCVPLADLSSAAQHFAMDLAKKPAGAMVAIKQALRRGLDNPLALEWEYYVNAQAILLSSEETAANIAALQQRIRERTKRASV